MSSRISRIQLHNSIHFLGITGLSVGLPLSKVVLSISMMLLIINLLLEGEMTIYWQNLRRNRFVLGLLIFWFLHIIALIWTSDYGYAFHDLRIKLSLLLIPLILVAKPIQSEKQLEWLFILFVSSLWITSVINFATFWNRLQTDEIVDIRQLSLFGSHIRYGILMAMGVAICMWLWLRNQNVLTRFLLITTVIWFGFYTYYSQVLSGLLSLVIVTITFVVWQITKYHRGLGIALTLLCSSSLVFTGYFLLSPPKKQDIRVTDLPTHTRRQNPYTHDLSSRTFENGKPVLAWVCETELRKSWNERSKFDYDSLDQKGQPLRFTLLRYMTSKGLKKDFDGFQKLIQKDIKRIEAGQCSAEETRNGLLSRMRDLRYQFHNSSDPNGHSLMQRIHFWKAGLQIFRQNWLAGVGTGDVQLAFQQEYRRVNSPLDGKNRLRAHNTYLTVALTFGVFGILFFLWWIIDFAVVSVRKNHELAFIFMLVAAATFCIEDTLETQMGATFFAFFFGLFASQLLAVEGKREQQKSLA
jgi:hypothetical protein